MGEVEKLLAPVVQMKERDNSSDVPGGHLKIPHLWPGQNPPVEGTGFSFFTL